MKIPASHPMISIHPFLNLSADFAWKYSFMTNCITKVQDISFRTFDISEYPTILELDHLVRQHPMPPMPHDQRTPSRPLLQATLARIIQHRRRPFRVCFLGNYVQRHNSTATVALQQFPSCYHGRETCPIIQPLRELHSSCL
jgi:hypothetical protein